jgi:hypothetical protein
VVRNRHGRLPIDEDQTQKVTPAGPGPRPAVLGGHLCWLGPCPHRTRHDVRTFTSPVPVSGCPSRLPAGRPVLE